MTHRNRNVKDKQTRSEQEENAREIKSQTPSTYLPTLARPLVLRPAFRTPLDSHPHSPPPPIAHRQSCVYRESAHKCKSRRTSRTKLASRSGHSSRSRRSPCCPVACRVTQEPLSLEPLQVPHLHCTLASPLPPFLAASNHHHHHLHHLFTSQPPFISPWRRARIP